MNLNLLSLIKKECLKPNEDGIYLDNNLTNNKKQEDERKLREKVSYIKYDNYLEAISNNHSISVMDHEVDVFLKKMPKGAVILDIGGCWGWHWRRIAENRPDISILIIDFVKSNLTHALNVLKDLVGKQILLMHADATSLPFSTNIGVFDGIWTAQTFQHIPDFKKAVNEAYRLLKPKGVFVNYSLHITPFNKIIYKILNKPFHIKGTVKNSFYLARANNNQLRDIENIFTNKVSIRYTENLFHPDLHFTYSGKINNILGFLDIFMSRFLFLSKLFARQASFEVQKL
jgi:ubiquinone/menaquinone biosynthesis C-methylase UbiE